MFTPKIKRNLRRIVKNGLAYRYDALAERAMFKQRIDECTENGQIAVCRSGQDCDGVRYNSVRITDAPKSFFAYMRDEDQHREYLDGPENMWIERPSDHDGENYYHAVDTYAEADGY